MICKGMRHASYRKPPLTLALTQTTKMRIRRTSVRNHLYSRRGISIKTPNLPAEALRCSKHTHCTSLRRPQSINSRKRLDRVVQIGRRPMSSRKSISTSTVSKRGALNARFARLRASSKRTLWSSTTQQSSISSSDREKRRLMLI